MENNPIKHPAFKNLVVTLLGLLVAFVAVAIVYELKSLSYIGVGVSSANTITVSGTGDVLATPDTATFSFTVLANAAAVPDAQTKVTDSTDAILAYLKQQGVADTDVQTDSYDINPHYNYSQYGQTQSGYDVSETIEVKVRKLDTAGTILSGVGSLGATNISGLSFTVGDETAVERQARDKAIVDARNQAQVLAQQLGVSIGRIVSFSESTSNPITPVFYAKMDALSAGAVAAPAAIATGQNKITSNVSVTYEIR